MRKKMKKVIMSFVSILLLVCISSAQTKNIIPDLSKVASNDGWELVNRAANILNENGSMIIHLDPRKGDGLAKLENYEFNHGTIEVDLKGKDVQGSSFVGIAFRGVNDSTFDAIYFRPFNFLSKDSTRQYHSVQYISQPVYTWSKLRENFPGKYENKIKDAPDPNSFFHAKIVVKNHQITVFVNNSTVPNLKVQELSERIGGWVGLWVGNYSDGNFANLKIIKEE
jgi:hypothetical protein